MLQNLITPTPLIIERMEGSNFSFFLINNGYKNPNSIFNTKPLLGPHNSNSSWEFFAEDSPEIRDWLIENKFASSDVARDYVDDGQCTGVFLSEDKKLFTTSVEVRLVKSAQVKSSIHREIQKVYPDGFSDKYTTNNVWKIAFATYRLGLESGRKLGLDEGYKDGCRDASIGDPSDF